MLWSSRPLLTPTRKPPLLRWAASLPSPAQVRISPARSPHPPLAGHVPASHLGQRPLGGSFAQDSRGPRQGFGSGKPVLKSPSPFTNYRSQSTAPECSCKEDSRSNTTSSPCTCLTHSSEPPRPPGHWSQALCLLYKDETSTGSTQHSPLPPRTANPPRHLPPPPQTPDSPARAPHHMCGPEDSTCARVHMPTYTHTRERACTAAATCKACCRPRLSLLSSLWDPGSSGRKIFQDTRGPRVTESLLCKVRERKVNGTTSYYHHHPQKEHRTPWQPGEQTSGSSLHATAAPMSPKGAGTGRREPQDPLRSARQPQTPDSP